MNVNVSGAYIYFTIPIFGGIPITQTTVSSLVVTLLLVFACLRLGKNLQKRPTGAQVLVEKLQAYITDHYYTCTKEILAGLGQMYVADERFRTNIDASGEGTAAYISRAVEQYCQ